MPPATTTAAPPITGSKFGFVSVINAYLTLVNFNMTV